MSAHVQPSARPLVLADLVATTRVRDAALVGGYALAIALSAQVAVPLPFGPVPLTLQTLAVLLGAAALGPARAVLGTGAYVGLGLVGMPWFAVTGGATIGYLAGFALAAAVVGRFARAGGDRTLARAVVLMVVGNLAIYALGVTGLALVTGMSAGSAVVVGVVPFLVGDGVKILAAAALLPAAWRVVDRVERG